MKSNNHYWLVRNKSKKVFCAMKGRDIGAIIVRVHIPEDFIIGRDDWLNEKGKNLLIDCLHNGPKSIDDI